MIVPQNRLLLWVALVILPFSLLGAIEPAAAPVSLVCITGLGLPAAGVAAGGGVASGGGGSRSAA